MSQQGAKIALIGNTPHCMQCLKGRDPRTGQPLPMAMASLYTTTDDEGYMVRVWHCTSCGIKTGTRVSKDFVCQHCGKLNQQWVKGGPGQHRSKLRPNVVAPVQGAPLTAAEVRGSLSGAYAPR